MKWVSVKERLPKPNEYVAIWTATGHSWLARYAENRNVWVTDPRRDPWPVEFQAEAVTHWMAIEEPEEA